MAQRGSRIGALVATTLGLTVVVALAATERGRADAAPPTIVGMGISGPPSCGCADFTLQIDSALATSVRLEWGPTLALGSHTEDEPILTTSPAGPPITLRWSPLPPAGDYFVRLVATSSVGSAATSPVGLHVAPDGTATMFLPPRPATPPPQASSGVVTVSPATPAVVVLGDTITFEVSLWLPPYWSPAQPARLSIVLPGNQYVIFPAVDPAFDLVSVTSSAGTCSGGLMCDFGALEGGSIPYVTFTLKAKALGAYTLVAAPGATPVTVPVTVVPRSADLGARALRSSVAVPAGTTARDTVLVTNTGPHVVNDAILTIGVPRPLAVTANVGGTPCSPVPIRCVVPSLAPGQSARLTLSIVGTRRATRGLPIGVSSAAASDPSPTNNKTTVAVHVLATRRS